MYYISRGIIMKKGHIIRLIPSFIAAGIIPLVVQLFVLDCGLSEYDWFSSNESEADFFLVGKMASVIALSVVMLIIIFTYALRRGLYREMLSDSYNRNICIFLGLYLVSATVSACAATGKSSIITGGYAQHETILVIISYGVIFLYTCMMIDSKSDMRIFTWLFICAAMIMAVIGVLQHFKMDVFGTDMGKSIITALSGIAPSRISGTFEPGVVYMTLYNPNYVGTYVSLVLPVAASGIYVFRKPLRRMFCAVLVIMLIICLAGSGAFAGVMACVASVLVTTLMYLSAGRKKLRYAAGIAAVFIVVTGLFVYAECVMSEYEYHLEKLAVCDDRIELTADGTDMYIRDGMLYDAVTHERTESSDITIENAQSPEGYDGINVTSGDVCMFFTDDNPEKKYYYRNVYGKYTDDVVAAKACVFDKCQAFASHRGYIWSKTIPLVKEHIFIGCGPDNFIYEFPNNDYLSLLNNGYSNSVVTRPHNMYLQTAVQTGGISLAAYVIIYVIYAVSCFGSFGKLRDAGGVKDVYIICMAIFASITGYMICAFAYDSSVCTAPVFWTLIAAGCACNAIIRRKKE